jgi:hypothetical protein
VIADAARCDALDERCAAHDSVDEDEVGGSRRSAVDLVADREA